MNGCWNKNTIQLSPHNLKGYDGVFIANYCINDLMSNETYPEMIATPTKLLQISFRNVKVIDSLSFLQMALDKFPKTFDIPEMKKGFYPHKFNTPNNSDYVGPFPDKSYYGHEYFSIKKKEELMNFMLQILINYSIKKRNWNNTASPMLTYSWRDVSSIVK